MSEHYDFHYQPTGSGAISGQQVLEQTEDAINELGDYVNDNVGGAMDVAQQALETAQNAEQDAQTALDTANSFSSAIQSAQQDASTALSTAQTAQTTASNANNTAIQAQQDASNAVTTANNASGQVSTLSGTVTALGQRVTTAEGNIGQNTSDITALGQRVTTAEGNITTLQNDVSIAQGNASSAMATAGQVKQQAFVFRYSSTALVASSTNSNTLLDNTDNLKIGDKVIDSSGVLFSITAIDTQNSTFTIGTALIDLANDSDVVHKSGDETIGGRKTFSENITCFSNSDAKSIICKTPLSTYDSTNTVGDNTKLRFLDKNNNSISYIMQRKLTNGSTDLSLNISNTDSNNQPIEATLNFVLDSANDPRLSPAIDNTISLGRPFYRYKSFYGMNYYYGLNNVEFSTKFVTTDTNQTISGVKTFSDNPVIGSNNANITVSNRQITANGSYSTPTGNSYSYIQLKAMVNYTDSSPSIDATVGLSVQENAYSDGKNRSFSPSSNNLIDLGLPDRHWANVYATNYYYGSNNVEFSTKFVTTDTNQTISGNKTFANNKLIVGRATDGTSVIQFINSDVVGDSASGTSGFEVYGTSVSDANKIGGVTVGEYSNNTGSYAQIECNRTVSGVKSSSVIRSLIRNDGSKELSATIDNDCKLGNAFLRWSDVQTYKVNGVEPSSLSLPSGNVSNVIDISSYITALDGTSNSYTAPANGWISIAITGTAIAIVSSSWSDSRLRESSGNVRMLYPVLKNETLDISVIGTTLAYARFIPCQGNV